METLKYVIEDSTIAELLGVQNFTNDESAVLELVKNAYDAKATKVSLKFENGTLEIIDNGIGMDADDIKEHWMHVGRSFKGYEIVDENNNKRILAGSKGIGRFALSRLGKEVCLYSKKENCTGVVWKTNWNSSTIEEDMLLDNHGTRIIIKSLREKWGKKKATDLTLFLEKTYNDDLMEIEVIHPDITKIIPNHFPEPKLGINCLSTIALQYNKDARMLVTKVNSDEFVDEAKKYCEEENLYEYESQINMIDELKGNDSFELSEEELSEKLQDLGNFTALFYFNVVSSQVEMDKFLYRYADISEGLNSGVILYRNAFSISAYEGKKDWLGLGKRSRKSPAAASHPTGAWRVRENQLAGKVEIDKKENNVLQDLSNRQGLDENLYYNLFVEIILSGIKEFERYRQRIIRKINAKNRDDEIENSKPVSDKVVSNPQVVSQLSMQEAKQLVNEIKLYKKEGSKYKKDRADVEARYKYDIRILNVLSTTGLKAASIAHEMKNDRNSVAENSENIVKALQEYGLWEELKAPDKTKRAYKNIPYLIKTNNEISKKLVSFMDTMLQEIEKKQFEFKWQSIADILNRLKEIWERDYAWIEIEIDMEEDICFSISEDIVRVIFDNLILNSIQQNEKNQHLSIKISVRQAGDLLLLKYLDNGKGLDKKYISNPRKILEVHETTREKGHGLGMWIVNNTVIMSGGEIQSIKGQEGFFIEFTIGGKM